MYATPSRVVDFCEQIGLTPKNWEVATLDERYSKLEQLESCIAHHEVRKPAEIIREDVPLELCGYVERNPTTGGTNIAINENWVKMGDEKGYLMSVATLAHESHHAYQLEALVGGIWHQNTHQTLEWFRNTVEGYVSMGDSYEAYTKQSIELSAMEHGKKVGDLLCLDYNLKRYEEINTSPQHSLSDLFGRNEEIPAKKPLESVMDGLPRFGDNTSSEQAFEFSHTTKMAENAQLSDRSSGSRVLEAINAKKEPLQDLITDWKEYGRTRPSENLVIVPTADEAIVANRMCQQECFSDGRLKGDPVPGAHSTLFKGDRVVFKKASEFYKVAEGCLGTITSVRKDKQQFDTRLDSGKTATIAWDKYKDFDLGYAVTVDHAQPLKTRNAYLLVDATVQEKMSSEVPNVRVLNNVHLYADKMTAGLDLETLAKKMKVSHQKDLALDHHRPHAREAEQRKPSPPVAPIKPTPSPKSELSKVPPSPAPPRIEPQRGIGIKR